MKEIKFSTANHPDQWWADDFGGVIKFASAVDAKAAEELFTNMNNDLAAVISSVSGKVESALKTKSKDVGDWIDDMREIQSLLQNMRVETK